MSKGREKGEKLRRIVYMMSMGLEPEGEARRNHLLSSPIHSTNHQSKTNHASPFSTAIYSYSALHTCSLMLHTLTTAVQSAPQLTPVACGV